MTSGWMRCLHNLTHTVYHITISKYIYIYYINQQKSMLQVDNAKLFFRGSQPLISFVGRSSSCESTQNASHISDPVFVCHTMKPTVNRQELIKGIHLNTPILKSNKRNCCIFLLCSEFHYKSIQILLEAFSVSWVFNKKKPGMKLPIPSL